MSSRAIAARALTAKASLYYFASGVLISLSTSALFAAFGTPDAPTNVWWLCSCGALAGGSSYLLWSLAGALEELRGLIEHARSRAGVSEAQVFADVAGEYATPVALRVVGAVGLAAAAVVALALGQAVQ